LGLNFASTARQLALRIFIVKDDPKETFRCQSFFAVYTVPLCTYLLD